jgi:diguanylate cyclase (GGDEF)-like protein
VVAYYQPEVELATGRLVAAESLAQHRAWAAAGVRIADLAQSCREHIRPDDIAGRYGGDEFILVIPGISSVRAIQIAARLTGPPARTSGADGQPVAFTVSVGIAEIGSCPDLPTLLAHADAAMYEAKRAGGGCWRLYEDTEQATALSRLPRAR